MIRDGNMVIDEAGRAAPLDAAATDVVFKRLDVFYHPDNSDVIWVGSSSVAVGRGWPLVDQYQPITFENVRLSEIWACSATAEQVLCWGGLT